MRGSRLFVQFLLLAATASFFSQQGRVGAQAAATMRPLLSTAIPMAMSSPLPPAAEALMAIPLPLNVVSGVPYAL